MDSVLTVPCCSIGDNRTIYDLTPAQVSAAAAALAQSGSAAQCNTTFQEGIAADSRSAYEARYLSFQQGGPLLAALDAPGAAFTIFIIPSALFDQLASQGGLAGFSPDGSLPELVANAAAGTDAAAAARSAVWTQLRNGASALAHWSALMLGGSLLRPDMPPCLAHLGGNPPTLPTLPTLALLPLMSCCRGRRPVPSVFSPRSRRPSPRRGIR